MEIEVLVEQVAKQLVEANPSLPTSTSFERSRVIAEALRSPEGAAAKLMSEFKNDSSFGDLRGGWIQMGNFGFAIQPLVILPNLVDGVILGDSISGLIEIARSFASSPKSRIISYIPVAGAAVASVVRLGNEIDLMPWDEVPHFDQKEAFEFDPSHHLMMGKAPVQMQSPTANMAIRIWSKEQQVLFSSRKQAKEMRDASLPAVDQTERVSDLIRCISLLSEQTVAELGNWSVFDNNFANYLGGTATVLYTNNYDITVGRVARRPSTLEPTAIARLFQSLERFGTRGIGTLRISIDRFNQALRKQHKVDKAIDLGIALEILLLHGIGGGYQGELKYRSSVRGAAFLGGDKASRTNTFDLLKDAYDLRSQAVHSGTVTQKRNKPPPGEMLEKAIGAYARIAQKLIERGSFPNWDEDYVIGES